MTVEEERVRRLKSTLQTWSAAAPRRSVNTRVCRPDSPTVAEGCRSRAERLSLLTCPQPSANCERGKSNTQSRVVGAFVTRTTQSADRSLFREFR